MNYEIINERGNIENKIFYLLSDNEAKLYYLIEEALALKSKIKQSLERGCDFVYNYEYFIALLEDFSEKDYEEPFFSNFYCLNNKSVEIAYLIGVSNNPAIKILKIPIKNERIKRKIIKKTYRKYKKKIKEVKRDFSSLEKNYEYNLYKRVNLEF